MNAELAVVHILQNDAGYNSLVGGSAAAARVYYDQADQTAILPNATVTAETVDPTDTKDNSNFDRDLIQVFHSAPTKLTASQMATAARAALEAVRNATHNGIVVNEIRYIDGDSFYEKITDRPMWTIEQVFRVAINN